jgi:predicted acetyltransferase
LSSIKPIPQEDLHKFVNIVADAYPAMDLASEEEGIRVHDQLEKIYDDERRRLVGLYRSEKLLGGMILLDFEMQVHSSKIETGGVGLVAVHLLHKKEKVAKELIEFFLRDYRERGAMLTSLYPFRPDFYKKMGFGYGPKIAQYKVLPSALPRGASKKNVEFVEADSVDELLECYNRYSQVTHGMIHRRVSDLERALFRPGRKAIAFRRNDLIDGYLVYSFKKGETFIENDIHIQELVYNSPEALSEILFFLHTQLDQVRRVVIATHDNNFHHLLSDPRNDSGNLIPHVSHETNSEGVGLMYRVINGSGIFEQLGSHDFGKQSCSVRFQITDGLLSENSGSFVVTFTGGRAKLTPKKAAEVSVSMDISDFSSLFMGTARFRKLYHYKKADISDPSYVAILDKLFRVDQQPVCMTHF